MLKTILTITLISLNLSGFNTAPVEPNEAPKAQIERIEQIEQVQETKIETNNITPTLQTIPGSKAAINPRITYFLQAPSPEDCTEYEIFDDAKSTCNLGCKDQQDCLTRERLANNEIEQKIDLFVSRETSIDGVNKTNPVYDEDIIRSAYTINQGEQYILARGEATEYDEFLISIFKSIVPRDISDAHVKNLIVYSNPRQKQDAYVKSYNNFKDFDLYINEKIFEHGYLGMIKVLIHEYAHILTLNSNTLEIQPENRCSTYFSKGRCLKTNSILNQYYQRFGKQNIPYSESAYATAYGAQNVEEDIAESFVAFILDTEYEAGSIVDQKTSFFNSYENLVSMKKQLDEEFKGLKRRPIDTESIPLS